MTRVVVFAYHNVGVRCLSVLLAHGIEVALVVTHRDNPKENIWFASVAELAALLETAHLEKSDPGAASLLTAYQRRRHFDNMAMMAATSLYSLLSSCMSCTKDLSTFSVSTGNNLR
mgnify:CR=1 FL=1